MPATRTTGESLFEQYLVSVGYEFEYEKTFEGRKRHPDYTLTKGGLFLCEVKDVEAVNIGHGFMAYDPYPPIREKINEARVKFKEFKDFSCALILVNLGHPLVHLEDHNIMLGSMYGDSGFSFRFNPQMGASALKPAFLERGKMVRPGGIEPQNTTISALITLRHVAVGWEIFRSFIKKYPELSANETLERIRCEIPNFDLEERHLGVIVWGNAYARIPLSRELFTGPYDERWGVEGDEQRVTFSGVGLRF